jgi:hypothetical protein
MPLINNETLKITKGFSPQTQFFIRYTRYKDSPTGANNRIGFFSQTPLPKPKEFDSSHRIALGVL